MMATSPVTAPLPGSPSSSTSPPPQPPLVESPPPSPPPPILPPPSESPPPPPILPPPNPILPPPNTTSPPPPKTSSPPPPSISPPPLPLPTPASPPPTTSPPPPSSNNNSSAPPTPPSSNINPIPPPSPTALPNVVPPPPQSTFTPPSPVGFLPPPAPTNRTMPSPKPSIDRSTPPNHDSSSEKLPLVVGITAGVGILFVFMVVILVCCFQQNKKKKTRKAHDLMQYYGGPSRGPKAAINNNPQSTDHVIMMPTRPGSMGSPLPPPMTSSSEMSSSLSDPHHPVLSPSPILGFNQSTFMYDELAAATNWFSEANLLGQGGFGYVHKGVLPNGKAVAVKSLKSSSGQGEREFQAEVEIISRVHHRHLVSLVGYCIEGEKRLLVYEFVPNKTLQYHLHGKDRPTMNWSKRITIALGSAKGLAYLHEDCHPRIIHRDIKAANILLDDNFEAMVADFGLAKLTSDNFTHVSTRVMGTFGYLAPEYASSGKLTEKSDVFSFGVMLLELITGQTPVNTTNTHMDDSLVDWARPIMTRALGDGNFDELVDPRLKNDYNPSEMAGMVVCAAASIRHSAKRRPKMSQIVRVLEGDGSLEDFNEGVKPNQGSAFNSSSDFDTKRTYNEDMTKFRKKAIGSHDYGNSEYSGVTSTYGLNPSSSSSDSEHYSTEIK